MRRVAWLVALVGFLAAPLPAQESAYFVPAGRIAVRVMSDVPAVNLAPGVHVRTVVGSTGSFSLGEFEAGSRTPAHHHLREQADFGISGVFDVTLGEHVEPVAPGAGFITPPNVTHSIANTRGGVMTMIEFHTVRRPDLVPPRPVATFPAAPEPVAIRGKRTLVVQMEKAEDSSETPSTIVGDTCSMT